jgi:hypothetical protein
VSAAIVGGAGAAAAGAAAGAELCAQAGSPQMSNAVTITNKHGLSHAERFIAYLLVVERRLVRRVEIFKIVKFGAKTYFFQTASF